LLFLIHSSISTGVVVFVVCGPLPIHRPPPTCGAFSSVRVSTGDGSFVLVCMTQASPVRSMAPSCVFEYEYKQKNYASRVMRRDAGKGGRGLGRGFFCSYGRCARRAVMGASLTRPLQWIERTQKDSCSFPKPYRPRLVHYE